MKENALNEAILLLQKAATNKGFLASTIAKDNYNRIWTRDGVIAGLAALSSSSVTLNRTFKNTLETIFDSQHHLGYFPSNVIPGTGQISYGSSVGRVDNTCWAIIGLCSYLQKKPDEELKTRYYNKVEKGFQVLDIWEFNGKHLMYIPMSGNWADEYYMHGYLLFEQLLRVWALELAYQIYRNQDWLSKANKIREAIGSNYIKNEVTNNAYLPLLIRGKELYPENYFLAGFNPGELYTQFDLQSNALAIYLNIGSIEFHNKALQFLHDLHIDNKSILPSYYPSISEEDAAMPVLKNNHMYRFRNEPDNFHNGGLWPVWNGFLLACIKNKKKELENPLFESLLHSCAKSSVANSKWEFNECFHGKTNLPNGLPNCTWSAAGLILANNGFYEN